MSYSGFTYTPQTTSETMRIVAITSVNAAERKAVGVTRERSMVDINCKHPVGGVLVTPAVGEQWYVQRHGFEYILATRLPANSEVFTEEAQEGQVQIGSSGPLTLHGSEVQVRSALKLGETLYRDLDGVLQRSLDGGQSWTAATAEGGGLITSVSGKTGDVTLLPSDVGLGDIENRFENKADLVGGKIPLSQLPPQGVLEYDTRSAFPATGKSNTLYVDKEKNGLFIWTAGSYLAVGGAEIAKAILGSGGTVSDLGNFFDGFNLGDGTLIQQILNAIAALAGGDLTNLTNLLGGIGSLGTQIVGAITGLTGGTIPDLAQFFTGFVGFNPLTGAGTLVQQLVQAMSGGLLNGGLADLQQFFGGLVQDAGTFVQQIIKNIIGLPAISGTLGNLQQFFTNIRSFLGNFDFLPNLTGGTFNVGSAANTFINSVLKQTGLLAMLGDIQQWLTGTVGGSLQTFFTNLRAFLGNFNFLSSGFTVAGAASNFITSVINPQNILATFATLQTQLTGVVGGSLQTFFTNLRKFLNLGSGTGFINLLVDPASFDLVGAINSFIDNVLSVATRTLSATLIPALDITKINNLVAFLTGKTTGITSSDLDVFFGNLRKMLNIGGGVGQINMLVSQSATALRTSLFNVLSEVNATLQTYITQTGLGEWLGVTLPAQVGYFFTNIGKIFKIVDFGVDPATFLNNIPAVAGGFIRDVINKTNDQLINPLKIASMSTLNSLVDDLGVRPMLNDLITWFSVDGVTNNLQKFFTNLRATLGGINFLPNVAFDVDAAKRVIYNMIADINNTVGTLAKQVDLALRPTYTALVEAVTGVTNAIDLTPIRNLFNDIIGLSGNGLLGKLLNYFTTLIAGATGNLSEFFGGFNGVNTSVNSLVHKIVNAIIGDTTGAAQTLGKLTSFFGGFTSTAATFLGRIIEEITKLVSGGVLSLSEFFDGFQTVSGPGLSIAKRIVQLIAGPAASTLDNLGVFFTNVRNFLNVNFLDPAFSVLTAAKAFIENVLAASGGVFSALNIPSLLPDKITGLPGALEARAKIMDLVKAITGMSNATLENLTAFFSGFDVYTGVNSLLNQLSDALVGTTTTLSGIKAFFSGFDVFTGANGIVKQVSNAITGSPLTAATLQLIKDFFANVRLFLGSINFLDPNFGTSLGTNLDTFINTMLKPRGIFAAVGDLASYLGGNALVDIERFFKNLASLFGIANLRTTLPANFNARTAGTQFLNSIFLGTDPGDIVKFLTNFRSFLGTDITNNLFGNTFNPTGALSLFVSRLAQSTGMLPLLTNGKLDPAQIPKLSVDALTNIKTYITGNFIQPMISTLLANSKLNLSALGIDITRLGLDENGLTALGTWANSLITNTSKIPGSNIFGSVAGGSLGVVPVGHIAETAPNLLSMGSFSAPSTIETADGWSWDGDTNRTGLGGTARVDITSQKDRELYSRQAVPVIPGDNMTVKAYVLTSGLAYSGSNPISVKLRFYNGQSLISTATPITSGAAGNWSNNPLTGTATAPAGATSVIVSLAVASSVTNGTVWFDDILLTKPGLMKQGLVDQLVDGWNNLWTGVFNTAGTIGSYLSQGDIIGALGAIGSAISNAAGTAFTGAQTAIGQIATLGGQLFDGFTNFISTGVTNLGNFIANIGTGIVDFLGSTLTGFINGVHYVGNRGRLLENKKIIGPNNIVAAPITLTQPVLNETFATPRTVPEMLQALETVVVTTYNTDFATNTHSDYFNTPRDIPAWMGSDTDDVCFPQTLIDGTALSTPTLGKVVLIPISAQQKRTYDAIRIGLKGVGSFNMTNLYVGVYAVNPTTGNLTKVIGDELGINGDCRAFLDPNYDIQTIPIGQNIGGLIREVKTENEVATLSLSTDPGSTVVGKNVVIAGISTPGYNGIKKITDVVQDVPVGGDSHYYNTTMLLHGNTSGSVTNSPYTYFEDSSAKGWWPATSGATVSTAQKKFGDGSLYFNGSAYLSRTGGQDMRGQDFTIETWIRPTAYPSAALGWATIYSQISYVGYNWSPLGNGNIAHILNLNSNGSIYYGMGVNQIVEYPAGRKEISSPAGSAPLDTWTHVAVVRNKDKLTLYINGVASSTLNVDGGTVNKLTNDGVDLVGAYIDSGTDRRYTGFIDEFRITKNVARYVEDFQPQSMEWGDSAKAPNYKISFSSKETSGVGVASPYGLVTLPSLKQVARGELFYIAVLQVGGTANGFHIWNKPGDVTTGQFPRYIGSTFASGIPLKSSYIGALPEKITNTYVVTGDKCWGALGAYKPYVTKGKVFYSDSFNRAVGTSVGVSWINRYGSPLLIKETSDLIYATPYTNDYTQAGTSSYPAKPSPAPYYINTSLTYAQGGQVPKSTSNLPTGATIVYGMT